MPSSYSPDLRIELIATGEQSGTWGTTTNNNLGTLIEDAISGKTSVTSSSSPYTLTAINGAADESRAAALELNCTGANFIVIVPTVTKLYVVKNVNATDSVQVKTAAGTGVTIPAGETALLRCNGTDVVEQLSYIAGTLTLNNALSVSSGGTGVASATAYSVLCGGTTSTGAFQSISGVGSSGEVLTSNGAGTLPTWQPLPSTPAPFASGTAIVFAQTAAPTGWTKVTSYNDAALRIVSGTASSGGSVDFSTAFANTTTGTTTLSTSQIPSHTHNVEANNNTGPGGVNRLSFVANSIGSISITNAATATGGGGSHDHPINLAVKYVDAIIATKN